MSEPIKYIRRLTIALMLSGAINVGLAAFIFYTQFVDTPPAPYYELAFNNKRFLQGITPSTHTPKGLFLAEQREEAAPKTILENFYKTEEVVVLEKPVEKMPPTPKPAPIVAKAPELKKQPLQIAAAAPQPSREYTIQEGDTLWKISRKYKVDVGQLKASNKLQSDTLRPGKTLRIP